jgi:NAD/NADP transhydrogenase beta subunit
MSASPLSPEDISPEVKQGSLAGLLGMMGMAVKIILTDEKLTVGKVLTRLFVAMVVAVLSGFALDSYIENKKMLWALNGLSGYMALEVTAWAESVVKARLSGELNKAQKAAGLKPAKPKSRGAKGKARR